MVNGAPTPPPRPGGPTGPGAGNPMKKSTKNWLIIGGVGAAGLVIWYVMKSRSASNQQAASAGDLASQGIDPNTGIPYSQEYGGYGAMGTTPSLYGYVDPTTGAFISGAGAGSTVLQPTTNASWAQQVEAYLQTLGYDPIAVGAAIGKYLTGQSLTADQQSIVAAALAFFGQPPQGAPPPVTVPPTGNGGGGDHQHRGHPMKLNAPGNMSLAQLAAKYGLRWRNLQHLNPALRQWFGKPIPKGKTVNL